jgi:hypothetical protein
MRFVKEALANSKTTLTAYTSAVRPSSLDCAIWTASGRAAAAD